MALDIIKVFHRGSTQLKLEILQNSKNMKHMFKVLKVQAYQENVYERGPGKIRHSQELTIFFFYTLVQRIQQATLCAVRSGENLRIR